MMDDIPKRKRTHTTANASRDLNDYRLNIKRQKNRYLQSEVADGASSASGMEDDSHLCCSDNFNINETEQVQSKLGQLHLGQLPGGAHASYSVEGSSYGNKGKQTCRSKISERQEEDSLAGKSEESKIADTGTALYPSKFSVPSYTADDVNKSTINMPIPCDNYSLVEQDFPIPDSENNWQSQVSHHAQEAAAETASQATTMELSQVTEVTPGNTAVCTGNRNGTILPSSSGNNNFNTTSQGGGLFSLSPDMSLNSNYTGIPLIPPFATRQVVPPPHNIPPSRMDMPRHEAVEANSTEWDDEGFDEPTEDEASVAQHLVMSDIEEDFTNDMNE